jgi:dTDP-4-amino-4,6-dideoxygalactose transaminase
MTTTISEPTRAIAPPALRPRPRLGLGAALIGAEEEALVLDVVRRKEPFRYYGTGSTPPPMAANLEKEFAAKMGTRFALAVTSGTAALEVALGALGVGPGDEVILPAYSWISCFTAVVRLGALPVLAEIDDTLCLAVGEITRLATPRTKAVMVVHYQGVAADMEPLLAEAAACGIKVIEDCAESPGAVYHGKRIGSWGDIGTFSFQFQKSMTSGEGGMVITDDPLLYERAVRMHDIGNLRPHHRQQIEPQGTQFCGSQFRMGELAAAMALAQLRKLDGIREHCRALQTRIVESLHDVPGLALRRLPDASGDSGIEVYLRLPDAETAALVRERLNELNVHSGKTTGTYCHFAADYCRLAQAHAPSASPFFKEFSTWPAPGYREEDFPRTMALTDKFVALPLGVLFTMEDADYIAACVKSVYSAL